ncbi:MAG: hypothetical protein ACP5D0_04930, partial [Hydrogenovibrio sp.]
MANSRRAFNAKKIIRTLFGDNTGIAVGVLLGIVLFSWATDMGIELIQQIVKGELEFPFVWIAIVIIALFMVLFAILLFWAKQNNQQASHTLELITPKPNQFSVLIGALSFNSNEKYNELGAYFDQADEQQNLLEEQWVRGCNYYPLLKLLNENPSIQSLVLLVSDKTFKQADLFHRLLKRIHPTVTLYVQQAHNEKPFAYSGQACTNGISFIQLDTLYQAYQTAYDFAIETLHSAPNQVLVDTTTGQATNSIAGAALLAEGKQHTGVIMDFGPEKKLQYFDINAATLD